jgi:hypothetical protein
MHVPRALALSLCAVLAGCSTADLAFRVDDRLQIENLADRSTIEVPFTLEFSFDGDLLSGDATAFGVLIDWTPPPPGKPLSDLLRDDPACRGPQGCPDGYLERNRIAVTTDTTYLMDNVPVGTDRQERRGFHEVTIILVDAEGRRVGESSAFARFRVPGVDA